MNRILVIDNASPRSVSPDLVRAYGAKLIRLPTQRGNIGGQNACFEAAQDQWVLFVADDVRLSSGCVAALWEAAQHLPLVGQVQPVCFSPKVQIDQAGMRWYWPGYGVGLRRIYHKEPYTVPIIPSTCYLMHTNVWKSVGGFDERLESSHEDVDMGLKLQRIGALRYVIPQAHAVHLVNQTLKETIADPSATFHRARQQVIQTHYRGLDRWLRLTTANLLDGLAALHRRRNRHRSKSSPDRPLRGRYSLHT